MFSAHRTWRKLCLRSSYVLSTTYLAPKTLLSHSSFASVCLSSPACTPVPLQVFLALISHSSLLFFFLFPFLSLSSSAPPSSSPFTPVSPVPLLFVSVSISPFRFSLGVVLRPVTSRTVAVSSPIRHRRPYHHQSNGDALSPVSPAVTLINH